jgi:hypothetical protein
MVRAASRVVVRDAVKYPRALPNDSFWTRPLAGPCQPCRDFCPLFGAVRAPSRCGPEVRATVQARAPSRLGSHSDPKLLPSLRGRLGSHSAYSESLGIAWDRLGSRSESLGIAQCMHMVRGTVDGPGHNCEFDDVLSSYSNVIPSETRAILWHPLSCPDFRRVDIFCCRLPFPLWGAHALSLQ